MADMIRSHRWEQTALGSIESWPPELLMAVNMMLSSRIVTTIYWGADRLMIYNDMYRPQLGERHPALGKPLRDVWPDVVDDVEPLLKVPYETGESTYVGNMSLHIVLHGEPVEKIYTLETDPIWCETASGPSICGLYHRAIDQTAAVLSARRLDVSEAKRHAAEMERESLTARLEQVLDATSDAVVSIRRDWVMTYANPRAQQIYGSDMSYLGRNVWEAFPEAVFEGSPFEEHYKRAMYERVAGAFEAYYPAPLERWLHIMVYPSRDGIVTFFRDVTEQKRASASLMQTEKLAAVGKLAASIAHEINNPLESVTNLLFLARSSQSSSEIETYLDTAERELRRISAISYQTLRFYKQSTKPFKVNCADLFQTVLSIYQGRLINSQITVEKRKRAAQPFECFEGEIRQVLNNLVGNAIDAMSAAGGRLLIRSRETCNWKTGERGIALTVADTGAGMPQAIQKRVFDAFYTTKGIGGTGLGLWVSCEIVQRHRGTLRFRSSQRNGHSGTSFVMFLPFAAATR